MSSIVVHNKGILLFCNNLIFQEVVTDQHRMKYERVKEQIAFMMKVMESLLQIGQNCEQRTKSFGEDMKQFSLELV